MGEPKATIKQEDPVSKLDVAIIPRSLDHTSWALKELNAQNHSSLSLRIHGWLARSLKRGKGQMYQQFLKQLCLESPRSENQFYKTTEKSLSTEIQNRVSVDKSDQQSHCASSVRRGLGWAQCRWQRMDRNQPNLPQTRLSISWGFQMRLEVLASDVWESQSGQTRNL